MNQPPFGTCDDAQPTKADIIFWWKLLKRAVAMTSNLTNTRGHSQGLLCHLWPRPPLPQKSSGYACTLLHRTGSKPNCVLEGGTPTASKVVQQTNTLERIAWNKEPSVPTSQDIPKHQTPWTCVSLQEFTSKPDRQDSGLNELTF